MMSRQMGGTSSVVYWLHNDGCVHPELHGYIGITNNPQLRWRAHRLAAQRDSRFPNDFSCTILSEGLRSFCLSEEKRLRPSPGIGWNVCAGGNAGRLHAASSCAKISAARYGRKLSDAARQRRREMKPIVTEETRAKMRAAALGRKHSAEAKAKVSAAFKGHPLSAEHRAKISAAALGRQFSAQTRAKMSIAAKARQHGIIGPKVDAV